MVNSRKSARKSLKSAPRSKKPAKILTNKNSSVKTSAAKKKMIHKAQSKKSQGLAAEKLFTTLNEILIEAKPLIKALLEMFNPILNSFSVKKESKNVDS